MGFRKRGVKQKKQQIPGPAAPGFFPLHASEEAAAVRPPLFILCDVQAFSAAVRAFSFLTELMRIRAMTKPIMSMPSRI